MVSNPLNTISQIGKLPQIEVNITKKHLKPAPSIYLPHSNLFSCCVFLKHIFISKLLGLSNLLPSTCWQRRIPWLFQTYNSNGCNLEGEEQGEWHKWRSETQQTGINLYEKNELRWWYYFFSVYYVLYKCPQNDLSIFFLGVFNHSRNHAIDIFITICVNMWKAITRVENHFGFKHLYILKLF